MAGVPEFSIDTLQSGSATTQLELPREPTSPGRARAELRQVIRGHLSENDAATATLLVSELVTNAVIHAGEAPGASVGLRITTYAHRLRVEVSDDGPGFELAQLPRRRRTTGGHGLRVVDGLASRWGIRWTLIDWRSRFCVWFELDGGAGDEAVAGFGAGAAAGDEAVAGFGAGAAAGDEAVAGFGAGAAAGN